MKPKKFQPGDLLLVDWEDILTESQWHSKEAAMKVDTVKVKTVGFWINNKGRKLRIAHSITKDYDCDVTVIPFGCISQIRVLEY